MAIVTQQKIRADALAAARAHFGESDDGLDECEILELAITLEQFAARRIAEEKERCVRVVEQTVSGYSRANAVAGIRG